jgi:hypothetical protein
MLQVDACPVCRDYNVQQFFQSLTVFSAGTNIQQRKGLDPLCMIAETLSDGCCAQRPPVGKSQWKLALMYHPINASQLRPDKKRPNRPVALLQFVCPVHPVE